MEESILPPRPFVNPRLPEEVSKRAGRGEGGCRTCSHRNTVQGWLSTARPGGDPDLPGRQAADSRPYIKSAKETLPFRRGVSGRACHPVPMCAKCRRRGRCPHRPLPSFCWRTRSARRNGPIRSPALGHSPSGVSQGIFWREAHRGAPRCPPRSPAGDGPSARPEGRPNPQARLTCRKTRQSASFSPAAPPGRGSAGRSGRSPHSPRRACPAWRSDLPPWCLRRRPGRNTC